VVVVVVAAATAVVVIQPSIAGCRYDRWTVYLERKDKKFIHSFVGKMPLKSAAEGQELQVGSDIHFWCKFSLEGMRKWLIIYRVFFSVVRFVSPSVSTTSIALS